MTSIHSIPIANIMLITAFIPLLVVGHALQVYAQAASSNASDVASETGTSDTIASSSSSPSGPASSGTAAASSTTAVSLASDEYGFGWIHTGSTPTQTTELASTNADAAPRTATGPVGSHQTAAIDFNGDYSSDRLNQFWDEWVRAVECKVLTLRLARFKNRLSTTSPSRLSHTLCLVPLRRCTLTTTPLHQRTFCQATSTPLISSSAGLLPRINGRGRSRQMAKVRVYGTGPVDSQDS